MNTIILLLHQARIHHCTPSVVLSAWRGSKWPHSFKKHQLRTELEKKTGKRRLSDGELAQLAARERGLWIAWSGFRSQPLPLP